MNNEVVMGLSAILLLGLPLLCAGLYFENIAHTLVSILPLSCGFWLLYKGIPSELRERRYRARYKRWKKLQEELNERDEKKCGEVK